MKYKGFNQAGTINTTELDDGLQSTAKSPKRIRAVLINVSAYEGNVLEGWIGNERVLEIYDNVLDTIEDLGAANFPYSTSKLGRIPIEIDVEIGQKFQIEIRCGGTASDIVGAYEYEDLTP